jgi:hypothetical protein
MARPVRRAIELGVVVVAAGLLGGAVSAAAAGSAPVFTADTPGVIPSEMTSIAYQFAATGTPAPTFSVSSGALPAGMMLDPISGVVWGAPTDDGQAYTFTVTASNGVSPDAVSPPISGSIANCTGNSGGSSTTTTTSVALAPSTVNSTLPDATASVTVVEGRVIKNGIPTVVYAQQAPVAASAPQAQALFTAAASADSSASPGSTVAPPLLASSATTTSGPLFVGQVFGPAVFQSVTSTAVIGPATITTGYGCHFTVAPGSQDINSLSVFSQTLTDQLQSTDTTTSTYDVDATPATVATATRLIAWPQIDLDAPHSAVGVGKLSATLTSGGHPVAGQTITFNLADRQLCTEVTNANGVARCKLSPANEAKVLRANKYGANFAGNSSYQAASASTPAVIR